MDLCLWKHPAALFQHLIWNVPWMFPQVVINPNHEVAESDFTNNAMKCNCKYDGQRIWLHNCHIGEQNKHQKVKFVSF